MLSGVIAALVFNACAIVLPVSAASVVRAFANPDIIDYSPTPTTISATKRALDNELSRFAVSGQENRRESWNNLIAREMAENDIPAARGFALAAPILLGGSDVSKIRRAAASEDDQAIIEATLQVIEPVYARQRFRAVMNRREDPGAFDVLSDADEISRLAEQWLLGDQIDLFTFSLSGATLASKAPDSARDNVRLGASVIKIARNGARLSPQFAALLEQRVAEAVPPERLRAALEDAFQNRDAVVDPGETAVLAFSRALDPAAFDVLRKDLAHIGAAARAASPAGAALLLSHAHDSRDLRRIELLAVAGGDRAVAVAKRSASGLAIAAARGAIVWDDILVGNAISTALSALGLLITTHLALIGALRREWDGPSSRTTRRDPHPILSKAEAHRRPRNSAGRADASA